ncbi:MAG: GIY-YIG nuclease family protein [Acidobacteriota bacterium]|nr:GIY-YIG nuclease family protein [Acidobacteriota bacterium]MDH3784368.1 GIY-YIG nuclease family protein [Acidobacteriota bacterium]
MENANPGAGWWVYLLRCGDGSIYTGITNDLDRRLKSHQAGSASRYTRTRLPVEIVYRESQPDRSNALRREAEIKRFPRARKQRLINGH